MVKSTQDISSLLAFRDGEPVAADVVLDRAALAEVGQVSAALREMPDVPLSDEVWASLRATVARKQPRSAPGWQRYPLSTAASVLLVSAVVMFGFINGVGELMPVSGQNPIADIAELNPGARQEATAQPSTLLALMDRSQDLEQVAYGSGGWQRPVGSQPAGIEISPLGEFILYQLAEVDEAIEQQNLDESVTAQLWQQRVNLLQAFLAEVESQNPGRFENNRSM